MASNYESSINIGIKLQPKSQVKRELQAMMQDISKDAKIDLQFDTSNFKKSFADLSNILGKIEAQFKNFNSTLNSSGLGKITSQAKDATKEIKQLQNVAGKSINIGDGAKGFDELQKRANEIRNTVDSLAKVSFNTSKNGSLKDATITYTDGLGKVVTETMKWKNITSETEGVVKRVFGTTNVSVSENIQKIGQLESKIQEVKSNLQNKLNNATGNGFIDEAVLTNLQNRLNAINTNTPEREIKELKTAINNLASSESQVVRLQNTITKMTNNLANLKAKFGTIVDNKAKSELQAYEKQLKTLQEMMQKASSGQKFDGSKITSELNNMTYASKNLSSALQEASGTSKGFTGTLQSALSTMGIYVTTAMAVQKSIKAIKDGFNHVVEVEDSLISLRRIYEMTDAQAKSFTSTISEQAKALAMDTASLIEIVTMYKKLGYSLQEAQSMAVNTQMFNYSADINDINASATSLVSTLKGFGLTSNDIMRVADSIDQVGNNFAVNASDINTILQKSSSTMHTFNNSLDETIALGTTAQEIMQDASTVGNALKSISARITTNSKALDALKSMEISIENNEGRLKSTAEILTEVGAKWKDVGEGAEKASLANDLFGKNHISTGLSIIENYTQIKNVMDSIGESEGIVAREFATRMDSTSAKLEQLKQTINQMWEGAFSSDFTKGLVDGVTKVIQVFGNLPSVIALCTTALIVFKGQAIASAISGLISFVGVIGTATSAVGALGLAQIELNAIMATNPIGLIAIACTTAVVGLTQLVKYMDGATDRIVERFDDVKLAMDEVSGLSKDLKTLQDNMPKFEADELDTEDRQKFIDLNNQLVNQYPEIIAGYDSENQMFKLNIDALQELIKLKQESAMKDNASSLDEAKKELEDYQNRIEKLQEKVQSGSILIDEKTKNNMIGKIQEYQEEVTRLSGIVNTGTQYINDYAQKMHEQGYSADAVRGQLQALGYSLEFINEAFKLDVNNIDTQSVADKLYLVKNALTEIKIAGDISAEGIEAFNQVFPALGVNAENAKQVLSGFKDKINENSSAITDMANAFMQNGSLTESQIQQLADIFPELGLNADNATGVMQVLGREFATIGEEADETTEKVENLQDAFKGFQNEAQLIDDVIKEMSELGGITEDTYAKVIANDNVMNALVAEGDAIENLTNLRDLDKQMMQEQIDTAFENANNRMNAETSVFNNKAECDALRTESDAQANEIIQENAVSTADVQSEAYGIDASNFENASNDKIGMHDDVNSALATTSSSVVSDLGDSYAQDTSNFASATNDKLSMLDRFKNAVQSAVSWVSQKLSSAVQAVKNFFGGSEDVAIDTNGGEVVSNVASNYAKKVNMLSGATKGAKTSSSYSGASASGGGSSRQPAMVANPSSGSSKKSGSGSGSKKTGKSDAEKAQEEAEKYAEKIRELQSDISIDRYLDLNGVLESVTNELTALDTLQESLTGKAYQDSLKREVELYKQKQDALANINDEQRREAEELKAYLKQYGFYFDATGNLINSQQRLLEIQEATNAMGGNTEAELKKKQEWVDWVKELQDKTSSYIDLVNSKIPSVTNQWNQLGNAIRSAQINSLESVRNDLASAIKQKLQELRELNDVAGAMASGYISESKKKELSELDSSIKHIKEEIEDLKNDKESDIGRLEKRIKKLKDELKALDTSAEDKKTKLKKLQAELAKWQKDDSVFAKKKIEELKEHIAQLENDIRKDEINAEIDSLEEEKQEQEDYYQDRIDSLEEDLKEQEKLLDKTWDKILKDKEAYLMADKLLTENNQKAIVALLGEYAEDYKNVGTLLGTNFAEALQAKVEEACSNLKTLMSETVSDLGGSPSSSNGGSSSGGRVEPQYGEQVQVAGNVTVYTDAKGTAIKGTMASNGFDNKTLVRGEYDNGFYAILDNQGRLLGYVPRVDVFKKNSKTAQFAKGGRTPSNIDNGAMAVLHSDEAILNAKDTEKLDAIYSTIKVSQALLDRLGTYLDLSAKVNAPTMPNYDYNRIFSGNHTTNNNGGNVTVNNEINVTNNTKSDSYFSARSLEQMFKNQIGRFGGK